MGADQRVSEAVLKARRIVFEGNSQYRTPYSRELEGEFFDLIFDDGSEMIVSFPFRNRVSWTWEGRSYCETGHVMKAEDGAFYVMTEVAGSEPRQGLMLLLDVAERLVTGIFLQMGAVKERPNLVTREVKFGAVKDGDRPLPAKRHEYTKDLVGKKIDWAYSPDFNITHVYLADNCYTVAFNDEMKAKLKKQREENPDALPRMTMDPYYEEDCLYIKLRENLYLFSFIEKNLGGTQGMMIINTDRLHDVGSFWGPSPEGGREGYMFSAYGRWVRDHIPEDDTLEKAGR